MFSTPSNFQKGLYGKLKKYTLDPEVFSREPSIKAIRRFMERFEKGKKILDVGCADGELLAKFTKKHTIYGLDNAPNLLKLAAKKGFIVKEADLEAKMPFEGNYFDVVVANQVIEHVFDTDKLLAECNRVMKKDGDLLVGFPNISSPLSFILLLLDLPPYQGARYRSVHVRDFTTRTLKTALNHNGFKVIRVYGSSFLWQKNNLFSFISRFFPRLSPEVIIWAQKNKNVPKSRGEKYFFSTPRA